MRSRRKKITPVMPSRVTTTGIVEDKVNRDNRGLFQNQMNKNEYWTYDEKLKDIVIMEIPRHGQAKVKKVFNDIPVEIWKEIRTCMKEFIVDDKKDDNNEENPETEESPDDSETPEEHQETQPRRRRRRQPDAGLIYQGQDLCEYSEDGVTDDVSDVYEGSRYGYKFVYNYDKNQLQCVSPKYECTIGLSRQDWEDNPQYWVDSADRQVEQDRVFS